MDIAFDYIVVHEAIDYIGAFPLGGAYYDRIPKKTAFIDEAINTYPLAFPEIFERIIGIERIGFYLEFLPVAGGVQLILGSPVYVRQLQLIHQLCYPIIARTRAFGRKEPVDGIFKFRRVDLLGDSGHFASADTAP